MNSRQRFLAILYGETPDFPPLFPEGIRDEVLDAWHFQGLAPSIDLSTLFDYDPFDELDPDVYPAPQIADWTTPARLLPLLRRSLDPDDPRRLPPDWTNCLPHWRRRTYPLFLRIHQGLFLSLGIDDFRSFAPALLRLVDQPVFVHQIMEIQADFAARLAGKILRQVDVDGLIFSEPIAGNHGALVSPAMYRSFALESYAPVFEVAQRHHVPALIWRSYANPACLLPTVLEFPFNALWLCETPPGELTIPQVRAITGPGITLIGGIDSDILRQDPPAIHQAIAAVQPFVAQGRTIPLADGRVREDVPYPNYVTYRQELQRVFRPQP